MKENGLLDAGYEYLNLDDCWGVRNNETNHIEAKRGEIFCIFF